MLELFRKYSAFAIIVLIVLFFGLIFMVDGVGQSGFGTGPKLMSIDGVGYTNSQVDKEGNDYMTLFREISGSRNADQELLFPYAMHIAKFSRNGQADPIEYMANRKALKKLSVEYGVYPNQEQIEQVIKEKVFVDKDGAFDQDAYDDFVEKRVRRNSLGVKDLNDLIGEIIAMNQLSNLVGGGLMQGSEISERAVKIERQVMTYEVFSLPIKNIQDTIKVTDEEVKAFWEETKGNYLTEPKIKVQYVISDGGIDKLQADFAANEKVKAIAEGKSEEEVDAMTFTLPNEQKVEPRKKALTPLENLYNITQNEESTVSFEKNAQEQGLEVVTTDLFTPTTAPEDLQIRTMQGVPAMDALELSTDPNSFDAVSKFYTVRDGRYLLFRLLEKVDAVPLPYEEAKEEAKSALIDKKLSESMDVQTEALRTQLTEATQSGSGQEAAEKLEMFYEIYEDATFNPQEYLRAPLFQQGRLTEVNEISEPVDMSMMGNISFVRPIKRSYSDSAENQELKEGYYKGTSDNLKFVTVSSWFTAQRNQMDFERYDSAL